MLGHCGSDRLQKTVKNHGFQFIEELQTCEDCAIVKARHKNVNKEWKGGTHVAEERLHLDITSIKDLTYGGSKFCALIAEYYN